MTIFFVTGTGTDIGKTYFSCQLITAFRSQGIDVRALKPVISGYTDATVAGSDTGLFLKSLGLGTSEAEIASVSPWRFLAPLSPDVAAEREGQQLKLDDIVAFCRSGARGSSVCLVEGAGGIMSPLGHDFTNIDLAAVLGARSILLAGSYLGAISHALTACEAMRIRQAGPDVIVVMESVDGAMSVDETARSISRFTSVPVFTVARGGSLPEALVNRLALMAVPVPETIRA
jgi:dethiobiotin synthetase